MKIDIVENRFFEEKIKEIIERMDRIYTKIYAIQGRLSKLEDTIIAIETKFITPKKDGQARI